MEKYAGVWIDHEKAFIVRKYFDDEDSFCLESGVEGSFRLSGGSRSPTLYGPQDVASEKKIERRRSHHLYQYYQEVIKKIRNADRIMIFGPGEAKFELEKEMKTIKELNSKIIGIETTDKMTERQIVAKVKKFFGPKDSRKKR
jgi:hypothetical protein